MKLFETHKIPENGNWITLNWDLVPHQKIYDMFKNKMVILDEDNDELIKFASKFNLEISMDKSQCEGVVYLYLHRLPEEHRCQVCVNLYQLYLDLLFHNILHWLEKNNVTLYFIDMVPNEVPVERQRNENDFVLREKGRSKMRLPFGIEGYQLTDYNLPDYNIIGGRRITTGNPKYFGKTIYFFGACIALGSYAKDSETIESIIQDKINKDEYPIRVLNSSFGSNFNNSVVIPAINTYHHLIHTRINQGDIVVLMEKTTTFDNGDYIKKLPHYHTLKGIFSMQCNRELKCFKDSLYYHVNYEGNHAIAEFLYNDMVREGLIADSPKMLDETRLVKPYFDDTAVEFNDLFTPELEAYLNELKKEKVSFDNIGAIVMNCNPFTKGHLYLVECAKATVDYLYVFVVQEDKSLFSFQDRFNMAKINCHPYDNVKVLPSGKFIISSYTFAEYFKKDELQQKEISPLLDVNLFCYAIAPTLNIKKRFVGTEPFDNVTDQYNRTMKDLLPQYGMELVEIPRYQLHGNEVNATQIRNWISTGNMQLCREYLTEESYKYILRSKKF